MAEAGTSLGGSPLLDGENRAEVDSGRFCQFGRRCLGIFDGQTACGAPQWFGIPEGELEAANLEGFADCLGERPKDPSDVVGATNGDFELVAGDAAVTRCSRWSKKS
ncbi:MAG TPA: hypothetical protein VIX85_01415 [Acidimicrobiales bacterium]